MKKKKEERKNGSPFHFLKIQPERRESQRGSKNPGKKKKKRGFFFSIAGKKGKGGRGMRKEERRKSSYPS